MNGESVKYQYYESNKRSFITIPVTLARSLNWNDKDNIGIVIKNIDDKQGLFLFKKEEKKDKEKN